ncbi:MAG: 23S rRNA (adenine(2503)-C(2))-methyltransferase RlmN [Phycisphaerae bacterium]|nr:23S rRNA (adenine(2503)-C(2))-methyltransferase RlmN [Phycisphaerae bacterium]
MTKADQFNTPAGPRQLYDCTADLLRASMSDLGQPPYRAGQILEWVYHRQARSFDEMTNLSKDLRRQLAEQFCVYESEVVHVSRAADGVTKFLLRWADGETTECVSIPSGERRTACLSTQVGCPVGCVFCASGMGGVRRNLSAGQIVEQAMVAAYQTDDDTRLSNVVFMGIGEPLANYDATVQAIRTINAAWGMNIGARKITISTVGLPEQILRLADENLQVTLALSLHAPNDELRARLIPWARRVSIAQLIEAARDYFAKTGREVTLEYVLLGDLNDRPEHARQLADVARRMRCNVNLILYNPVEGVSYARPQSQVAHAFLHLLRELGGNAHLRQSRGLEVDGACGQLRRQQL